MSLEPIVGESRQFEGAQYLGLNGDVRGRGRDMIQNSGTVDIALYVNFTTEKYIKKKLLARKN